MKIKTHSVLETQKVALELAQKYNQGGIFALSGPLGAGKTTFIQGFAQGLGIKDRLISPTFIIMRQYQIPSNNKGKLYHLDLYRLETVHQTEGIGLEEILANSANIVLIEWAEKLGPLLPPQSIHVTINLLGPETREITIS